MSVAGAADALTDRGEDIEEDEHEQERLDDSAQTEDDDVLAQHHEVTPMSAPSALRLAAKVERTRPRPISWR